jgi:hypothetical protein
VGKYCKVGQEKAAEKIKTHILCAVNLFFEKKIGIMWKNILLPQTAIWRMSVACWTPKATSTHTQVL